MLGLQLDELMLHLTALLDKSRQQSLSVLVPMGEEMNYRYQETMMAELLRALRQYKGRLPSE